MNSKPLQWPESLPKMMYSCAVCNSLINCEENGDYNEQTKQAYLRCHTPSSRYWNIEHTQVYCSSVHMMEAHLKGYKL